MYKKSKSPDRRRQSSASFDTAMKKSLASICLLLVFFYASLDGTAARFFNKYSVDTRIPSDCLTNDPPIVCLKKFNLYPTMRIGRRLDPSYGRSQRGYGIVAAKSPRIGRSDPLMAGLDRRIHEGDEEMLASNYQRVPGLMEESLRNLENYFPAQRRDSNGPWSYFLITPNFQDANQQFLDYLLPQAGHDVDTANDG